MADNMEASLCCNAIKDAFKNTKAGSAVIIHSDAGSQYTSNIYKKTLILFYVFVKYILEVILWKNKITQLFIK